MAENGSQEMTALEKKITEQIEYYFGDHNLPKDKFLKEQIQLDDGWVPLEIMIKFNRLNRLTTDFNVIVDSLKKSTTGLVEVSEDKTKIRRSPDKPLPEINDQYKDDLKNRSVYVKGFPTDITLDELKEWFAGKGTVENIQMRRNLQRQFKGSVFVVFDSNESAKIFVETPDLKYKDTDMVIYLNEKEEKQKQAEEEEMGTILFKSNAKEALEKAKEANGGTLKVKNKDVVWEVLEGEIEKQTLKKMIEDQQETFNKKKGKGGRKSGGKGRGGKRDRNASKQSKVQFQGKKTTFDSEEEDEEEEEEAAAENEPEPTSPKKRSLEGVTAEEAGEPKTKQMKTENGSENE
ncbi:LA protein, partial [Polypterus senegalus]